MNYITLFHLINFQKENWYIVGEIQEYVDHININDKLTVEIEVRKCGDKQHVDYPIIQGRVARISKCIERNVNTGKYQLVTSISLHIDLNTVEYIQSIIDKLENNND